MEKYLHAFNMIPGIGYRMLKKLLYFFETWERAWETMDTKNLITLGLSPEMCELFLKRKKEFDVDREFEKLARSQIVAIAKENSEYPDALKEIPNAPFILYRKGASLKNFQKCIAIVGTRMSSRYGEKIAFDLSQNISIQGGTVVSGLAFGIDAQAHMAAIKNQKPTIAIMASGLMNVTPPSHNQLARNILKYGGTILSEYAQEVPSMKYRYLERNRLISGLSEATIIIEANIKSGALITANHALEQNRPIYALPGDITRPQAQGCLRLIYDGANPIVSLEQTMEELGFLAKKQQLPPLIEEEKNILSHLQKMPSTTEELFKNVGIPLSQLLAFLSFMEMKGYIYKNRGQQWEIGSTL